MSLSPSSVELWWDVRWPWGVHPGTLTTVNSLASLLHDKEELEEAEDLSRRALEGREKALGPDHPGTLSSVHILACVLFKKSLLEEADLHGRRAVTSRQSKLGDDHPDTLASVLLLAAIEAAKIDENKS